VRKVYDTLIDTNLNGVTVRVMGYRHTLSTTDTFQATSKNKTLMCAADRAVAILCVVSRSVSHSVEQFSHRLRPLVPSSKKLIEVRSVQETILAHMNVQSVRQITTSVEYITYLHPFRPTQLLNLLKEYLPVLTKITWTTRNSDHLKSMSILTRDTAVLLEDEERLLLRLNLSDNLLNLLSRQLRRYF